MNQKRNVVLTSAATNQILQAVLNKYIPANNVKIRTRTHTDRGRMLDTVNANDELVKSLIQLIESGSE